MSRRNNRKAGGPSRASVGSPARSAHGKGQSGRENVRGTKRMLDTRGGASASSARFDSGVLAVWLLALAPVMLAPGLLERWGWPVLCTVILAGVFSALAPPAGHLPQLLSVLAGVFSVLLIGTGLAGEAPLPQLMGRAPRYEGLILWGALALAVWSTARVLGPGCSARRLREFSNALSLSGVLLGGVSLVEALGLRPIATDVARPGSLAGNATDQGLLGMAFFAVLGSLVLGNMKRGRRNCGWHLCGVAMSFVAVATSGSRAAILAFVVVLIVLASAVLKQSTARARDAKIIALVTLLMAVTIVLLPVSRRMFDPSSLANQTVGDRFVIWKASLQLIRQNLWLGVGPNGFADAITGFLPDQWFHRAEHGSILDSPHNVILQVTVAVGLVGLLLAVATASAAFVFGWRNISRSLSERRDLLVGASAALLGLGTGLLTHVTSPKTLILAAMLVGVLVAQPDAEATLKGQQDGARDARMRSRWILAGSFAMFFLLASISAAGDFFMLGGVRAASDGEALPAQRNFEKAARLRPWDADVPLRAAEALGGLAEATNHSGAAELAESWARDAVDSLPNSARAHHALGMILLAQNEAGLAIPELKAAAQMFPAEPRIHHELAMAMAMAGDLVGSREQLLRAGSLAPDSLVTWQLLEEVCTFLDDSPCVKDARESQEKLNAGVVDP